MVEKTSMVSQLADQLRLEHQSDFALCNMHVSIPIPYNAKKAYEILAASQVVLYGFGDNGKNMIYPQLKNMGARVCEIWDMRFKDIAASSEDIPLVAPHKGLSRDTLILISVKDVLVSSQIKINLHKLGYTKILDCCTLDGAIKYKIIDDYFPFLLQINDDKGQVS